MLLLATMSEENRTAFEFAGLPEGWGRLFALALLAALCYAVVWLYRREGRAGASTRVRAVLAMMRCSVLLLLAGIWLEPVIATYVKRTLRATTVVLVDSSASMGIADMAAEGGATSQPARIDQVRRVLTDEQHRFLKKLAERNELAVYTFGERTRRLRLPWEAAASQPTSGAAEAPVAFDEALTGRENHTDIGQAMTRAIGDVGEGPIACMIVFSDGIANRGLSTDDLAVTARSAGARVYSVGVGEEIEPANVRVTSFSTPATVSKGDPIEVRVEVSAAGIEATPMRLELTARPVAGGAGEPERTLATREITVGGSQPTVEQRFRVETDTAGEFVYRARVEPLPIEAVTFDNIRSASVLVIDDQLRVLIVAGRPTFDYRAVTALLSRDKTINLSCWLQSADPNALRDGTSPLEELPRKAEDLFAYDAILLMDPDPRELDSSWAVNVRRLVDELGGGVLLQAGPFYTGRFLRDERLTDLVSILPIAPDPDAEVRLSERGSYHTQAMTLRIPDETRGHPVLQLHTDPNVNRAVWDSLSGAWWYLPVLREKPLAAVLLRGAGSPGTSGSQSVGGSAPLLMTAQPFGAGRTLYLGFEGTWRWRGTAERYFNRFWVQVVRYLAQARRQGVSRRGTILLDRESYDVGQFGRVEARVLDATFAPWQEPEIDGEVEVADGSRETIKLTSIPGREGWFSGRATFEQDGPAIVRVPLPGGKPNEALVKHAQVQRPDVEMRTLRLRSEDLTRLAQETDGKYVPIALAAGLPDELRDASQTKTERGPRHALWDRSWVLGLIVGLLGVEWFVRRRNHLL